MTRIQVVVTGVGATTPLGGDAPTTWRAMTAGTSRVELLRDTWSHGLKARLAARVAVEPSTVLGTTQRRHIDRSCQLAVVAAEEAWSHAGRPDVDPQRFAVVIGTGIGGGLTTMAQNEVRLASGPGAMSPFAVPMMMPNAAAAVVSTRLGAKAGAHSPTSACAAGAEAIALGADLIRAGRCDVVVAGGTEACIHPFTLAAFGQMGALSTRHDSPETASRPFDQARDGFVLAEGAAVVVLQRAGTEPPGRVLARLAGSGTTSDATDMVAPNSEGQVAAMRLALRDAELTPTDVAWVNAHATSTPKGDAVEAGSIAAAVRRDVAVTATKSMTGHLLGASGALAAVGTVLGLRDGLVPAVRNLARLDDRIDLDVVRDLPRRMSRQTAALCNAFGFGGHNVSLAFTSS